MRARHAAVLAVCALLGCERELVLLHADGGGGGSDGGELADAGAGDAGSALLPLGTTTLAAGPEHTCAIRGGALYCWGEGADGQLGDGRATASDAPVRVAGATRWAVVTVGARHTCALDEAGAVWCFGFNSAGQLGVGDTASRATPERVGLPAPARDVQSRSGHTCALLETGELKCWGANAEGQLGLDDTFPGVDQAIARPVASAERWRAVAAGDGHTCAIATTGHLWCWGRNSNAHLGLGAGADGQYRSPQRVGADRAWIAIAAHQEGGCAIREDRSLWCWGGDINGGQLAVPTRVGPPRSWGLVRVEVFHLCALELDGALWCGGRGIEGQLGLGDLEPRAALTPVMPGSRFAAVSAGRFHTCARAVDGTVACAGANDHGQLGVGDRMRRSNLTDTAPFP